MLFPVAYHGTRRHPTGLNPPRNRPRNRPHDRHGSGRGNPRQPGENEGEKPRETDREGRRKATGGATGIQCGKNRKLSGRIPEATKGGAYAAPPSAVSLPPSFPFTFPFSFSFARVPVRARTPPRSRAVQASGRCRPGHARPRPLKGPRDALPCGAAEPRKVPPAVPVVRYGLPARGTVPAAGKAPASHTHVRHPHRCPMEAPT